MNEADVGITTHAIERAMQRFPGLFWSMGQARDLLRSLVPDSTTIGQIPGQSSVIRCCEHGGELVYCMAKACLQTNQVVITTVLTGEQAANMLSANEASGKKSRGHISNKRAGAKGRRRRKG